MTPVNTVRGCELNGFSIARVYNKKKKAREKARLPQAPLGRLSTFRNGSLPKPFEDHTPSKQDRLQLLRQNCLSPDSRFQHLDETLTKHGQARF